MKRLVLLAALATPLAACETMALYEGDRDAFARLVEVMEPLDISPSDRGGPQPLPVAQPPVPPAIPNPAAAPAPQPLRPQTAAVVAAPTPRAAVPQPLPTPAVRRPLPAAARLAVTPPTMGNRLVLDQAAPKAPPAKVVKPLPQPTKPAVPVALPPPPAKQPDPPQPVVPAVPSPTVKPVPAPPPVPAVPAPTVRPAPEPPAAVPSQPAPSLPATPKPPPPIALDSNPAEANAPTARERGRPLIKRTNKITHNKVGAGAGFTSADGQMGAELGTDIGRAARPIAPRSPQSTRRVISAAKGDLAECYVNEQLFQEDAKGTAVVIIEVPKELPNLPRIETSDFTDTMNVCLLEAVRNLPFPGDPEGAVYRLRVPFRFRPD